jgi:hypothetical protein
LSRIIDATCLAGVVTADGLPVPGTTILSQGTKQSSGALEIDGEKRYYFTSNATDIKDLITNLEAIIQQVVLIATNLDAVTVSPGSATALITQLGVLKVQLGLTKDNLK